MDNLSSHRLEIEKEYEIGYKISNIVMSIIDKKSHTIDVDALNEANEIILFDNVKFKEYDDKAGTPGDVEVCKVKKSCKATIREKACAHCP